MLVESNLRDADKEWGRLGACYLIALALQKMIPSGQLVGLCPKWRTRFPGPAYASHAYIEVSGLLIDAAGIRSRAEMKAAIEGECQDPEDCRTIISLPFEDVEALAERSARETGVLTTSSNKERAACIAAQLRDDVRHLARDILGLG